MTTGIGEALRAARRQQGRSLADAAAATRVRESYLAALEEEEFAALGGDVYVKGFLRSYARFLGLNPEPLLESYRREHERPEELPPLNVPSGRSMDPDARRGLSPLAIAATLALALLAMFLLFDRGGDTPTAVPAPSPVSESPADGTILPTGETELPGEPTFAPDDPAEEATTQDGAVEPTDEAS